MALIARKNTEMHVNTWVDLSGPVTCPRTTKWFGSYALSEPTTGQNLGRLMHQGIKVLLELTFKVAGLKARDARALPLQDVVPQGLIAA